ncbi:MAG: NUDIX hydrolase [Desulfobacterales bacterium]|jgi:ADP-ribose pyrophosphatase
MKAETIRKKAIVKRTAQVYKGRIFDFVTEDLTLPNGRDTEVAFIRHPGSIAVVPLLDDNIVVMEKQYRHPVGEYLLEIPAGTLEPNESPLDCAKRELMEETGFRAQKLVELGKIHMIPAYSDEEIHVFIARGLTPAEQNLDPDEIIDVVTYPLAKAVQMIEAGKITDTLTIACIQMAWFYVNGRSRDNIDGG